MITLTSHTEGFGAAIRLTEVLEQNVRFGFGGLADQMMVNIADRVEQAGMVNSPVDTGTLRDHHEAEYIPPDTVELRILHGTNPRGGGDPAVYGTFVHASQPWLEQTYREDVPGVVEEGLDWLVGQLEGLA